MTLEQLQNKLKVRVKDITTRRLKRKVETTFQHISEAAAKWKQTARHFLSKPSSNKKNTSLYPRKRTGKLRNSVFYSVKKSIGKSTASLTVSYGFHEVYSTHSKKWPRFAYGSYLNKAPATYGGYRERLQEKLVHRIETILRHTTI